MSTAGAALPVISVRRVGQDGGTACGLLAQDPEERRWKFPASLIRARVYTAARQAVVRAAGGAHPTPELHAATAGIGAASHVAAWVLASRNTRRANIYIIHGAVRSVLLLAVCAWWAGT